MHDTAPPGEAQARAVELAPDARFRLRLYSGAAAAATAGRFGRRFRLTGASLLVADVFAAGATVAVLVVIGLPLSLPQAVLVALAGAVVGAVDGCYTRRTVRLRRLVVEELGGLMQLGLVTGLLLALMARSAPVVSIVGSAVALAAGVALVRGQLYRLATSRSVADRCVVVGQPARFPALRRQLATAGLSLDIVKMVDIGRMASPSRGGLDIEDLIEGHAADRVIVAAGPALDQAADLTRRARRAGASVTILPLAVDALGPNLVPELVGGNVAVSARASELTPGDELLKRAFDLVGAAIFISLLVPFMGLIAALIKATSPGPVLFWQERVGRDGRVFRMAKFRTMVEDAEARKPALRAVNEAEGLFKIVDDPRCTRIGKLLRKTALDELPQLINVLRGDMSLVGPRPLVGDEDASISGWHRDRLRLAPGMTGPWQVEGSARIGLQDMVLLDHHYVCNWSIAADLQMLLRTVWFVVTRRGM